MLLMDQTHNKIVRTIWEKWEFISNVRIFKVKLIFTDIKFELIYVEWLLIWERNEPKFGNLMNLTKFFPFCNFSDYSLVGLIWWWQMPLKATERDVYEFFSKAGKVGWNSFILLDY